MPRAENRSAARAGNLLHPRAGSQPFPPDFFCPRPGRAVKGRNHRVEDPCRCAYRERSAMRRAACYLTVTICLVLGVAGPGRADDQAQVKAVIEKAVEASGGKANLTRLKAFTCKLKGKLYGAGDQEIDFT